MHIVQKDVSVVIFNHPIYGILTKAALFSGVDIPDGIWKAPVLTVFFGKEQHCVFINVRKSKEP